MTAFLNNVKTAMLMAVLTAILVMVGAMLGKGFIIPFAVLAVAMNFGSWFFSDKIAIGMMRGREVDASSGGRLYEIVNELRQNAGLPMPRVFVCPQQAPNAFATGRNPAHAAVAVTQGALQLLNEQELRGVLGHELAHVKNHDTLTSTIAGTIAGLLATIAQWSFLLGAGNREGGNPLMAFITLIFAAVGAAMIKAMISRSREFVADADGSRIAGSPDGLISALQKLETVSQRVPLQNPNPAANNMFIVEPLTGGRTLMSLFATHPPTEARIEALRRLH